MFLSVTFDYDTEQRQTYYFDKSRKSVRKRQVLIEDTQQTICIHLRHLQYCIFFYLIDAY